MSDVTRILNEIEAGNQGAVDRLILAVYQELRYLAKKKLQAEAPGQTLQPTALVHEAYLRLLSDQDQIWRSRTHFFSAAAEAMRRILVDNARRKKSLKRGDQYRRVTLEDADLAIEEPSEDIVALDEALSELAASDKLKADLVKLRYFAGFTIEQAADALGLSLTTAKRNWKYARAWLYNRMTGGS
ncbi:MAG: sigma-70 family RNA polymerase sigma factor [Phycisphaerales bacterium]|nr:MAG: sigma-70 family RNA polymerase sigma factor [Phycisphaerales bacterium]